MLIATSTLAALVRVGDALGQLLARKIEAREIARVGLVVEAAIDRVRAGVDRDAQGRRSSRGADEFERAS